MNSITNLHQDQNKVIVSMGYDSITTSVTLIPGHGAILPDPSITGSYDLAWWNASDYLSPTDDPFVEIVKCIAKLGDTLIVMRSQQQTLASSKNIDGKLYNMAPIPDSNLDTLSYYNIPQIHDNTKHSDTYITQIAVDTHASATATHGATGAIVGTANTQTLTNKTISGGSITDITDLTVADGGTGRSVTVAYTPICGGTTTTAAHQSVASTGTAGQVLTSNGDNALPTFQNASGGINIIQASETSRATATGLTGSSGTAWYNVKTFTFNLAVQGTIRVKMTLGVARGEMTSATVYGQLRYGAVVIASDSYAAPYSSGTSYDTPFSGDGTINLPAGGALNLWIQQNGWNSTALVTNVSISYDAGTPITVTPS